MNYWIIQIKKRPNISECINWYKHKKIIQIYVCLARNQKKKVLIEGRKVKKIKERKILKLAVIKF